LTTYELVPFLEAIGAVANVGLNLYPYHHKQVQPSQTLCRIRLSVNNILKKKHIVEKEKQKLESRSVKGSSWYYVLAFGSKLMSQRYINKIECAIDI